MVHIPTTYSSSTKTAPSSAPTKTTPIPSPPLSTSALTQTAVSPAPIATADGVHLVNSIRNFQPAGSELAYYKSAADGTDTTNQHQPDDTVVITANINARWEGQNYTGELGAVHCSSEAILRLMRP